MQFLRHDIQQYGFIELPNLTLNKSNYTLAQRSPQEHGYSSNHYLTDFCQQPHQDTPPYPTAFWLEKERSYFFTWLISFKGMTHFFDYQQQHPNLSIQAIHQHLVPLSLNEGWGLIVNKQPGLILIDNSHHSKLYHARSCNFQAMRITPNFTSDTPMYAFNEIGLLNYIDQLDSRRGTLHRNQKEKEDVAAFMQQEKN